jgi:hypothetical protein
LRLKSEERGKKIAKRRNVGRALKGNNVKQQFVRENEYITVEQNQNS